MSFLLFSTYQSLWYKLQAVFVSLKVLGGRSLLCAEAAAQPAVEALALWHQGNERAAAAGRLRPERIAALAQRGFSV